MDTSLRLRRQAIVAALAIILIIGAALQLTGETPSAGKATAALTPEGYCPWGDANHDGRLNCGDLWCPTHPSIQEGYPCP